MVVGTASVSATPFMFVAAVALLVDLDACGWRGVWEQFKNLFD